MKNIVKGSILVGLSMLLSVAALAQPTLEAVNVPATIVSGDIRLGRVVLSGPTTTNLSVELSSTTGANVNDSVTVLAGSSIADFPIRAATVSSATAVTITGTLSGIDASGHLTIETASLAALYVDRDVIGGRYGAGTIVLDGTAGAGVSVDMASSNAAVLTVNSPLPVDEGKYYREFYFLTAGVDSVTTATVTATYKGVSKTKDVTIHPASEAALVLEPSTIIGGRYVAGFVQLNGRAGAGGDTVVLGSGNPLIATVPPSVKVPEGAFGIAFLIRTHGVAIERKVTISATFDGVTRAATLTVEPADLARVLAPPNVVGGNDGNALVQLDGAAGEGGLLVSLSSDNAALTVPGSVTVVDDTWQKAFAFETHGVDSETSATVSATAQGLTKTAQVVVHPAELAVVLAYPSTVIGGNKLDLRVLLGGRAGPGGAVVTLGSDMPGVLPVPDSTKVLWGNNGVDVTLTSKPVTSQKVVTVTATYRGVSKKVAVTVNPPG